MEIWEFLRMFGLYVGGAMMAGGAIMFGRGLKTDEWKPSVKGLFLCMMGIFGLVIAVIAKITGR